LKSYEGENPVLSLGIILAHLVGDYILQTDWMAAEKTKRWKAAIIHGLVYTIPYVFVTQSPLALLVIGGTHMVIDRYRLARYVIWFSNQIGPKEYRYSWEEAKKNAGYGPNKPAHISVWLLFIIDNTIHLGINAAAVYWL
jgi:hypothetical protein